MKPCIIQIPPPTGYEYLDVLQIACGINHCDAPAADSVCKAPLIYAKKTRETRTGNYKTN